MKKIFFLVILIVYIIIENGSFISAETILENLNIYNMEMSDKYVAIEYQKQLDNSYRHYITLYDIENESFIDIMSPNNELINDNMYFPSISRDGKYVTFTSRADNIVKDTINDCYDIEDGKTKKCSNVYIYNTISKRFDIIKHNNIPLNKDSYVAKVSGNGTAVVFESLFNPENTDSSCIDLNGVEECINILKYNIVTGIVSLISSSGKGGGNRNSVNPSIDYEGRFITYQTNSSNILKLSSEYNLCINSYTNQFESCINVYLYDTANNESRIISAGEGYVLNNHSGNSIISQNGLFVAYETYATNLSLHVNYRKHIVVYDIINKTNSIVTITDKILNNRDSNLQDISYDGKYVLYTTNSSNLIENKNVTLAYITNCNNYKTSVVIQNDNDILISKINGLNIYFNDDSNYFFKSAIDSIAPKITTNQKIYIISNDINEIIRKIDVCDNLTSREKLQVIIQNYEDIQFGSINLRIKVIDEFGNESSDYVNVEYLEKDSEGPVFKKQSEVKILKGSEELNLLEYITAHDKVDGIVKIYIIEDNGLDLNKTGKYKLKLMAKDKSDNYSYTDIYVTIYDNYNFVFFYEILMIFVVLGGIIFLLIKVK